MLAIIDADPIVYSVGFSCGDETTLKFQQSKVDEFVNDILVETWADDQVLYLTGKGNFRFDVATIIPYKGNRDHSHRPIYYKELRDYIEKQWAATVIEGMEADDACSIKAKECRNIDMTYTVCTIDKDLKMIGGNFYDYKRREHSQITEEEAWRFFFTQILTGDSADNIPGLFKVTGSKATKKIKEGLLGLDNPDEMASYVRDTYLGKDAKIEEVVEIGTLLWMRTTEDGRELQEYYRAWGWI